MLGHADRYATTAGANIDHLRSGSIGWSQFFRDPRDAAPWELRKLDLYRRLTRVLSYTAFGGDIEGARKIGYKLARARVPHGDLDPVAWAREIRLPGGVRAGPAGNGS